MRFVNTERGFNLREDVVRVRDREQREAVDVADREVNRWIQRLDERR